ncbi:hypothetical protein DACRYDRAFT_24767 [Dacryopinax primogenitus]|uniref:Uncharacterized protein n=1 Tax=Dacryopinax primogenitus (strain DJM 731) TaxID=1858805 RepID=M5FNQ1_DACPD|nr:uncharacterized protein DACRYDRAFT_24767 [Dacryopinax primogenitus]EJT97790.1 hypothetical protein DACRYDRAFT_24767 [Dacryopinax primogenitus]
MSLPELGSQYPAYGTENGHSQVSQWRRANSPECWRATGMRSPGKAAEDGVEDMHTDGSDRPRSLVS